MSSPSNVLNIRELDVDMIPPITAKMDDPSHGGSKIVVIGKPGTGKKPLGGGHDWEVFQDNLSDHSFTEILNKDITRETARTYDLINQIIGEVADPVRSLSAKYLDSQYPKGMKFLRWYFKKKIKRINRIYFSGNMTGDMFNKLKTYRVLLYRI